MKNVSKALFAIMIFVISICIVSCSAFNPAPNFGGGSADEGSGGYGEGEIGGAGGDSSESYVPNSGSGSHASPDAPSKDESYGESEGGDIGSDEPSKSPEAVPGDPMGSTGIPGVDADVPGESGDAPEADAPSDPKEPTPDDSVDAKPEEVILPSGMITAGAQNDNEYYSCWVDLFNDGKFTYYTDPLRSWGFNSLNRVKVTVLNGDTAVAGAEVVATDVQGNPLFSAVTDAAGVAYVFVGEDKGEITVTSGDSTESLEFTKDSRDLVVQITDGGNKLNVIEIMLVVDVTGSMGDEINFLKAELADVINRIAANDSDAVIKLAMLFYRDKTDKVPFDYYDFKDVTTEEGLLEQQAALDSQRASGGGDYPEAVDEALDMAVNQQWSTGATTKIIFHVLDAPAHTGKEYATKLVNATNNAAEKGIRVCPIICSGAAELTEYTMREVAIYTGGTFIYVTDDSGIGGSHHDPNLPNTTIELLNSLMVRLVNGYHSGTFDDPIYWKEDPNLGTK